MEIFLDGAFLDVELEEEKNVGSVLRSFSEQLNDTGFRLSGFSVDGSASDFSNMEELFLRDLEGVKKLFIETKSIKELYVQALLETLALLDTQDKKKWLESSARSFLENEAEAFANLLNDYFLNSSGSVEKLKAEIKERLFEIENPHDSLLQIKNEIELLKGNLASLSLDIQLGQDKKAAQNVLHFTIIAEKITRLFYMLNNKNKNEFIEASSFYNFRELLKEFLESYEREDYVLTGDLAEYEIAPRISAIYDKLCAVYAN